MREMECEGMKAWESKEGRGKVRKSMEWLGSCIGNSFLSFFFSSVSFTSLFTLKNIM